MISRNSLSNMIRVNAEFMQPQSGKFYYFSSEFIFLLVKVFY